MCFAPSVPDREPPEPTPEPEKTAEDIDPARKNPSAQDRNRRGKKRLVIPMDNQTSGSTTKKPGLNIPR